MYELTIDTHFAAAHNLRGYEGACERLHGHNWIVRVYVQATELDDIDIAIDFKKLKSETNKVIERLDHYYLNKVEPFDKINTTAENISKYLYEEIGKLINDGNVRVSKIKVWESEKAAAAYFE
ncbi:MAG: 6-carboxytetrahydropterin synthase QueD [Deltaproteobacteria bacterium]|nr:6-carboxytetrahydropterin synthase QueD [Deltaproteobacteria bacterium]